MSLWSRAINNLEDRHFEFAQQEVLAWSDQQWDAWTIERNEIAARHPDLDVDLISYVAWARSRVDLFEKDDAEALQAACAAADADVAGESLSVAVGA